MFPMRLPGARIETVDKSTVVCDVDQVVLDRHGCQTAVNLRTLPEDVSIQGINACQGSRASAVQGVLTDGHVHPVVMKNRCANDFTGSFPVEIAMKTPVLPSLVWA